MPFKSVRGCQIQFQIRFFDRTYYRVLEVNGRHLRTELGYVSIVYEAALSC